MRDEWQQSSNSLRGAALITGARALNHRTDLGIVRGTVFILE